MSADLSLVAAFVGVVALVYLLVVRVIVRTRLARRMGLAAGRGKRTAIEARLASQSASIKGVLGGLLGVLGAAMPLGDDDRSKIAVSLRRAGYESANSLTVMLGVKALCLIVGLVAGLALVVGYIPGAFGWLLGLLAGLGAGVGANLVPEMILARLAANRTRRIHMALGEAFDLLVVCLESGLTFERALQRTVRDLRSFQPDLAHELGQASLDMSVHGRTREDALARLATRLDSQDFQDLKTTVAQSERHGTPLADSLRKFGASVRVKTISRMQARMARLPVLLVLPTIAFVLPGILVLVAAPAILRLLEQLEAFGG